MPTESQSSSPSPWLTSLQDAVHSGRSAVYAMRSEGPESRAQVIAQLADAGLRSVVLRPAHRWSPLAPLRQLCDQWERAWPTLVWSEEALPLAWLGLPVLAGQLFAAIATQLQGCPTVAWVQPEAFQTPVIADFLRAASQGELAMPVTFVCQISPDSPLPSPGMAQLRPHSPQAPAQPTATEEAASPGDATSTSKPPNAPGKRTMGYLSQALFFGDALTEEVRAALKAVSRADHARHQAALRGAGLLGEDDRFALERLHDLSLPTLPQSQRWRRRALAHLPPDAHPRRLWLQLSCAPALRPGAITPAALLAGLLQVGPEQLRPGLSAAASQLAPEQLALGALALLQLPQAARTTAEPGFADALQPPYSWLYQARKLPLTGVQGCHALRELHQQAQAAGAEVPAALIALDLVRWQQALGQEKPTFALLAPYKETPHWAIQWQRWCLLAEAYRRMERPDMARHALEQAAATAPKPLSPVLAAELRLFTAKMHTPSFADTDPSHPETQLHTARQTFRAMGDGRRLASYFRLMAERQQERKQREEARTLFAQALQLSRQYNDGIGAQIAEIQLGLLRRQRG